MQLLAAVACLATTLRLRWFRLFFFLRAARTCIGLGFLKPCLFFGRIGGGFLSCLASVVLGILKCLGLFLASLYFGLLSGLFLGLNALLLTSRRLDTFFLFATLGIERFLLFLRLLFKDIALDIRALAPYLDVDRTGTSLVT